MPGLALPLWGIAGVGMGLGFLSVSFLLLQQSGASEVGFHSSAAQISDQLATATLIGVGGAVLAGFGVLGAAITARAATMG